MRDLTQLIAPLLKEYSKMMKVKIPNDTETQEAMLKSLLIVHRPDFSSVIDESWLQLEAKYLKEKNQKDEVGIESILSLAEQFNIVPKPVEKKESDEEPFEMHHSDQLYLIKGDISTLKVDAVVNSTNEVLVGSLVPCEHSVEQDLYLHAGVELRIACDQLVKEQGHVEPVGFAKVTKGFHLPCDWVIHTVVPRVDGMLGEQEEKELASCYDACLAAAQEQGARSVAFPFMATGFNGYPKVEAAMAAIQAVDECLDDYLNIEKVVFVAFTDADYEIYKSAIEVLCQEH